MTEFVVYGALCTMKPNVEAPLVIEFIRGSKVQEDAATAPEDEAMALRRPWLSKKRSMRVILPDGRKVSLPVPQLLRSGDEEGCAKIAMDGMSFEGMKNDQFVFWRVQDLNEEEETPAYGDSEAGDRLSIDPQSVSRILVQGRQVWPRQ